MVTLRSLFRKTSWILSQIPATLWPSSLSYYHLIIDSVEMCFIQYLRVFFKWPTNVSQNHHMVSFWQCCTVNVLYAVKTFQFLLNKETFHFRMIFHKKPWDWESELWASPWTSLWFEKQDIVDLFVMFIAWTCQKLEKFINFCLKVGHSANLNSKSTWRQLIVLWKVQNHNIKSSGHNACSALLDQGTGTIDLR